MGKPISEMGITELLAVQDEAHGDMVDMVVSGRSDSHAFRTLARVLNDVNVRLVALGYTGK